MVFMRSLGYAVTGRRLGSPTGCMRNSAWSSELTETLQEMLRPKRDNTGLHLSQKQGSICDG